MQDNYSNLCSIATGAFGVAYIQDILGIIILVLSIANILINAAIKIYKHFKEKNYSAITEDISEASERLNKIKEENEDV